SEFNKHKEQKCQQEKRHHFYHRRIAPTHVRELIHGVDEKTTSHHQQNGPREVDGYALHVFLALFQKFPGEVRAPNPYGEVGIKNPSPPDGVEQESSHGPPAY